MALAEDDTEFDGYINKRLKDINADAEIFSTYIKGILETDESVEEKKEAIEGILSEITDMDINEICSEILNKWKDFLEKKTLADKNFAPSIDVEEKLAQLMEETKVQSSTNTSQSSSVKNELKKAILAQYGHVSDGEASGDETQKSSAKTLTGSCNMNVNAVIKAEKEKREKDKEASHKKKEKDKEDRAKQKSKEDERKEKEKKRTQKGERRR